MSTISIRKGHHMSHSELVAEVEHLADKLVDQYGGDYGWDGDELTYSYSGGVTAKVACSADEVAVDVKLGMLMSMMKGAISREIEDYLARHIA